MNWGDNDQDDGESTVACGNCGKEIYDDAVRCPYCGYYQTDEDKLGSRQPRWVVITGVCLLAWFLYGLLRAVF